MAYAMDFNENALNEKDVTERRSTDDIEELADINKRYSCQCDESVIYDTFVVPERAEGMWVWVKGDDTPYLDMAMGLGSLNFGHNHPEIREAVLEAAERISQIHYFHNEASIRLGKYLVDRLAPDESYQVYFDVGGSSAICASLRLSRAFTGRSKIVCFHGAYHGTGYGPAAVTDGRLLSEVQYGGNPLIRESVRLPYPNPYHGIGVDECIGELERAIKETDPAAVLIEPIQGAGGFIIAGEEFLRAARELTARHNVVLIDDEIQVGMGRTGRLYCVQNWGVTPDIVLLSKSLAGGYYPLSAVIARSEYFDAVPHRGTAFQTTFNNNPFGTYIALRTVQLAEREKIFENVRIRGERLINELSFLREIPWIGDLHGLGLAISFEIVSDENTRTPDADRAKKFVEGAFLDHILFFAAGVHRNVIKLAPPLNVTDEDIDIICEKIRSCVSKC